jgi:hypothetical protein
VALYTGLIQAADDHPNNSKPFVKPGTTERPISSYDKGHDAIYLWLKRQEHGPNSLLKTHGHFFYELKIADTVFPL